MKTTDQDKHQDTTGQRSHLNKEKAMNKQGWTGGI